jgi:hypothetical protein
VVGIVGMHIAGIDSTYLAQLVRSPQDPSSPLTRTCPGPHRPEGTPGHHFRGLNTCGTVYDPAPSGLLSTSRCRWKQDQTADHLYSQAHQGVSEAVTEGFSCRHGHRRSPFTVWAPHGPRSLCLLIINGGFLVRLLAGLIDASRREGVSGDGSPIVPAAAAGRSRPATRWSPGSGGSKMVRRSIPRRQHPPSSTGDRRPLQGTSGRGAC